MTAVHIKPLGENAEEQALRDLGRTEALYIDRVEGSVKFSFEDSDEQTQWQAIIESAARAAQKTDSIAQGVNGSNFTRFLARREENQIITDFAEAETDSERAALRNQVARVFCTVDKNNDRTVSLQELSAWLSTASKGTEDVKTIEVTDWVQQKFQDFSKENHSIRVTLEEFWILMCDGGAESVIEKLKNADLWTHLALKHVFDEQALGQMFDEAVSHSATEGDNYIDVDQLLVFSTHGNGVPATITARQGDANV